MEKSSLIALGHGSHRFSKDRELLTVPRGNPRKECENVYRQTFSVLYILHNHERVKKPCVFLIAGKVDDIDFMGYLWERFFPVATLAFRVENDRLSPKENRIVNDKVIAERSEERRVGKERW